jgi:hypothetical protein
MLVACLGRITATAETIYLGSHTKMLFQGSEFALHR